MALLVYRTSIVDECIMMRKPIAHQCWNKQMFRSNIIIFYSYACNNNSKTYISLWIFNIYANVQKTFDFTMKLKKKVLQTWLNLTSRKSIYTTKVLCIYSTWISYFVLKKKNILKYSSFSQLKSNSSILFYMFTDYSQFAYKLIVTFCRFAKFSLEMLPITLWSTKCTIIAAYHRNARPIIRYNIGRTIGRANHLCRNQNDVNELTQKHESKCTEFEQTDGRIAEIESINSEHSQENW